MAGLISERNAIRAYGRIKSRQDPFEGLCPVSRTNGLRGTQMPGSWNIVQGYPKLYYTLKRRRGRGKQLPRGKFLVEYFSCGDSRRD